MNLSGTAHDLEFKEVIDEKAVEARQRDLVLFNDDVNTFDFVIEALIEVCNHDTLQAEEKSSPHFPSHSYTCCIQMIRW